MESKNLIGAIVAVTVGIILIGTVLSSAVAAYSNETLTYTNEGTPFAAFDDETHTIVVSYDGSKYVITTDGEECELPDLSLYGAATIVYGDDAFIRLSKSGQVRGYINGAMVQGGNVSASVTSTIVINGEGATLTFSNTTNTMAFTPYAYIAPEGEYVLSVSPCVTDDSIIIGGITVIDTEALGFVAHGTISDLTASVVYIDGFGDVTVTDLDWTVNTSKVTTNLVKIDNVTFTATMSDDSTFTGIYSYFLAPASVVYDDPDYLGAANVAILGVVVVMSIIAVLMIMVNIVRRD